MINTKRFLLSAGTLVPIWATTLFAEPTISQSPAENPPELRPTAEEPGLSNKAEEPRIRLFSEPTTEWILHKTADGQHPNGNEQQMVWLMNRARTDPTEEGLYLADTGNPRIESAISYFSVDLNVLKSEFAALAPKPPAAFDRRIYEGSKTHSDDLIARDTQDHNNQFQRVEDAGFTLNGGNASVFSYAESPEHAHAGFNVDWGGNDGTGMQTGRGHRKGIMATDLTSSNVGIAMVEENDANTSVGPLVTSIVYARARTFDTVDHYNRFLVGTVWEDANQNGFYDPGEGLNGVKVAPNIGDLFAVTGASGGWAIPALQTGDYIISFSGGDLAAPEQRTATVDSESVLVVWNEADTYIPAASPVPVAAVVRIIKLTTGGEITWTAEAEHDYQLQLYSADHIWTDDNREVLADGDKRTVRFDDNEVDDLFLARIVSTRIEL